MASSVSSRELILETLLMITRDGQYSHIALKNVLDQYQYLDKKERAFITRVVNGTLEHMIEIDAILNHFSKVKVNKMKPVIRTILRSSVYQMRYMDSVPDRAVCNEAVKLASKRGFYNLKGFVNGVLRTISRNPDVWEIPERTTDIEGYLSIRYSLPEWLVKQWLSEYDADTVEAMGKAFMEEKKTTIRKSPNAGDTKEFVKRLEAEGVQVEKEPEMEEAFSISGYDYLNKLKSFRDGEFYVQDISSMRVAQWAAPKENDKIIDVCAAPGGKSIHLAEKLNGTGMVEARDLTEYKVDLIWENIERSRLTNIRAKVQDARILDPESVEKADIVIADLPCSGLGVLGRKPDLRYKMTPQIQKELVDLQREILKVVCAYVKPGGKLLYSTCTVHRAENEENVNWFQKEHPEFVLQKDRQMLPGIDGGDGFYIAMFQKENHE